MAEGDEFENPTFDEDDYDDDIDDRLPMVPNETDQRILLNQCWLVVLGLTAL